MDEKGVRLITGAPSGGCEVRVAYKEEEHLPRWKVPSLVGGSRLLIVGPPPPPSLLGGLPLVSLPPFLCGWYPSLSFGDPSPAARLSVQSLFRQGPSQFNLDEINPNCIILLF